MTPPRRRSIVPLTLACTTIVCSAARAQEPRVDLVVEAGRPIRVALSGTATVKRVGQTVTATVVEPVYAFDRIVIPGGAQVVGRIAAMPQPSKANRARERPTPPSAFSGIRNRRMRRRGGASSMR